MDHKDNDDKAQELAKVMRLGQIMTGYEKGAVEDNLGVDTSDHVTGKMQPVVKKVEKDLPAIERKINNNNQKPIVEEQKKQMEQDLAKQEQAKREQYAATEAEVKEKSAQIKAAAEGGTKTAAETANDSAPGTITSRGRNYAQTHAQEIKELEEENAEIFKYGAP